MPAQFLDQLADNARKKQAEVSRLFAADADADERDWKTLTQRHWHPLPDPLPAPPKAVLYGVDGSRRVLPLANGAQIAVFQALARSTHGVLHPYADFEVIPGNVPGNRAKRFINLRLHQCEVSLAAQVAVDAPHGSIVFLDGGIYGPLRFLYDFNWRVRGRRQVSPVPGQIADAYVRLFDLCWDRRITLVGLSKTSRDPLHAKLWALTDTGEQNLRRRLADPPSVAEALYRWTDGRPGYSTPFILGRYSFEEDPALSRLLDRPDFQEMPAIVSFYIRLQPHDPPLRVETPVPCVGLLQKLVDMERGLVEDNNPGLHTLFALLQNEYVSREMYNSVLYVVDRQVRLSRTELVERYRTVIEHETRTELDLDRSARRFVSRRK